MAKVAIDVVARVQQRELKNAVNTFQKELMDGGQSAGKDFGRTFGRSIDTRLATARLTDDFAAAGRQAGTQLRAGITRGLNEAVSGITSQLGVMGGAADSVFARISSKGGIAAAGVAGIGVAAVVAGKQLYDLGAEWDDIADGIAVRTGKVGDEVTAIVDAVRSLGKETAAPLADIGDVAGRLSQSLHLSGEPLTAMTRQIADLNAMTGETLNIRELGRAFRVFGVDVQNEGVRTLDDLFRAATATGLPLNDLIRALRDAGPVARDLNLNLGQTAGLMATLEDAGIGADVLKPALQRFAANAAKEGQDVRLALEQTIGAIQRLPEEAARTMASDVFGARNFEPIFQAIRDGTLDVNAFNDALKQAGPSIGEMREQTADWQEEMQKLINTLKTELEPAASATFGGISTMISQYLIRPFQELNGLISGAGSLWRNLFGGGDAPPMPTATPITTDSALGRMLLPGGQASPPPGPPPVSIGSRLGTFEPPAGSPFVWGYQPPGRSGGGRGDGPTAPVAPYGGDPMELLRGFDVSSSLYGAAGSVLDARHARAQAEQKLLTLEATNTATAEQIQQAKNDLARAEREQVEAEMKLQEQKISSTEKFTSQMQTATDTLSDLSAQLDADFGISKGLGGIVENLVKAIGTALAYPALLQMSQAAQSSGGAYGLVGSLAANGAFGPQFTGQQFYGQPSDGYGYSGYPGDAALLAHVPAGRYSQTGSADLTQGLADCSSAVEDLVNLLDGMPTGGREMNTGNAPQWLSSRGFLPGTGGPGDFRVGFNSGHMQATLPGGTPFNWGSDAAAARGGVGGSGADDPSLTQRYYRPVASPAALTAPITPTPGWAGPGIPSGITGGVGQSPVLGANPLQPLGSAAGQNPMAPQPMTGQLPGQGGWTPSGGGGLAPGGLAFDAAMAATPALDALAPGAGVAAQTGMKLAQRGIQYGSQLAAVGVGGLLETFGLSDSVIGDPSKSWLGRVVAGFAGARPALPTSAGKTETPAKQVDPNTTKHGEGQGQPPGPKYGVYVENWTQAPHRDTTKSMSDLQFASHAAWGGR